MFRFMLNGLVATLLLAPAAFATTSTIPMAPEATAPNTTLLSAERTTAAMARRYSGQLNRTTDRPGTLSAPVFAKGRLIGGAGIRFNNGSTILTAQLEKGITDEISLGGRINFTSSDGVTAFTVGGVGAYHLAKALKVKNPAFDPFVGLYLALPVATGYGETQTGNVFGHLLLGSRYFLNDRFGLMGQLNLGMFRSTGTSLELGVSYAFK